MSEGRELFKDRWMPRGRVLARRQRAAETLQQERREKHGEETSGYESREKGEKGNGITSRFP